MNPELTGPPLYLDPIQQRQGEELRIHREAVDSSGNVGHAVQEIFRRRGSASPEVDQLGTADVTTAPEKYPWHLAQEVADGGRVSPLDRIPGKDDPGQCRPRPFHAEHRQHWNPDVELRLLLEIALGVVDGVGLTLSPSSPWGGNSGSSC